MTKKDIKSIARTIAHYEVSSNLNYSQQKDIRNSFFVMLWQKDHNFSYAEFEQSILNVHHEMYQDYIKDQQA